ncbi:hypothetical protein BDP67DRAFT_517534 [Colletotrichum lupini]|nr:hypothetical protein BDP67DRAFT_517534 [Colletotrichum lupini]
MTALTEELRNELRDNARILADYVKEIASAKSESRGRQRKLTVGHDPRSVATRLQSIANMSHAKKGIISTNETDRAVSVGGGRENQLVRVLLGRWMFCRWHDGEGNCLPIWRLGFLLQLEDHGLRQHWKSIRKLSRVLRHIHRHLRDSKAPGAHARALPTSCRNCDSGDPLTRERVEWRKGWVTCLEISASASVFQGIVRRK